MRMITRKETKLKQNGGGTTFRSLLTLFALLTLIGLSACGGGGSTNPSQANSSSSSGSSSSSSTSSSGSPNNPGNTLQEGVLLNGSEAMNALAATEDLNPTPVVNNLIINRLLSTRLSAILHEDATVADVNSALSTHNAAITTMLEGQPFVSLAIEPVASKEEAQAKAQALLETGAFVSVRPAYAAPVNAMELDTTNTEIAPTTPNTQNRFSKTAHNSQLSSTAVNHVFASRLPAAWNLSRAASHDASLIVPDAYVELEEIGQYDQLPLLYLFGSGTRFSTSDTVFGRIGNLGYLHLGIAAGEELFDGTRTHKLGANPVAIAHLDAFGVYNFGMSETDLWAELFLSWPTTGNTVLLLDGSYNDPDETFYTYLDRAWSGFMWRRLARTLEETHGSLLMVAPTGDYAGSSADAATFNSAFGIATLENISALAFLSTAATEAERQAFIDFYTRETTDTPAYAAPLENVLLVGSSNASGVESDFSVRGAQVRAQGENVVGPCLVSIGDACDSNGHTLTTNKTMAAASQIAGLATYLWHIDENLSPQQMLLRLQHAYSSSSTNGILDAWTAILSLDDSLSTANLRRILLDISGPESTPDGQFNEDDINAFLDAFDAFAGATEADWSVYDLNADGWTNGSGRTRMDLDVNNLPGFTSVTRTINDEEKTFDENAVSDTDVLCYYAYTFLYDGEEEDIPTIPGCNDDTSLVDIATMYGRSVSVSESYGVLGETNEQIQEDEILASFSISSASVISDDPEFDAFTDATSQGTVTVAEEETSTTFYFTATAGSTAMYSGDVVPGKSTRGTTHTVFQITFLTEETLEFDISGSFSGGGSTGGVGFAQGVGYSELISLGSPTVQYFRANYDSDDNGSSMALAESGTLEPGFYSIIFRVDSGTIMSSGNADGGAVSGSGAGQLTLTLSRPE